MSYNKQHIRLTEQLSLVSKAICLNLKELFPVLTVPDRGHGVDLPLLIFAIIYFRSRAKCTQNSTVVAMF